MGEFHLVVHLYYHIITSNIHIGLEGLMLNILMFISSAYLLWKLWSLKTVRKCSTCKWERIGLEKGLEKCEACLSSQSKYRYWEEKDD